MSIARRLPFALSLAAATVSAVPGIARGATKSTKSNKSTKSTKKVSTTKPSSSSNTVLGSAVDTRWGPVQVQLSIAGHKVVGVKTPQYPNHKQRSQEINTRALPLYRDEVLTLQSAQIDIVSGATDTWSGYSLSLQAALDDAKAKGFV